MYNSSELRSSITITKENITSQFDEYVRYSVANVSTSTKNVVLYDCSRNENVLFVTLLGDDRNTKGTTLLGCVAIMN